MIQRSPEEIVELARQQIALRETHAVETRASREIPWRYAFIGLFGALLLGLVAWPGTTLDWKMYSVVHGVCAQVHNIGMGGQQLPICARNTGIYASFLMSSLFLLAIGRKRAAKLPPLPITVTLILFVVALGVDGFNSMFNDALLPHLYPPQNIIRTLTGIGMGTSLAVFLFLILNNSLRSDARFEQPVIGNWLELGGALLLNGLMVLAIYGNLAIMYWPIAFIAWFGIIGVLYCVNLLVAALATGYENRVSRVAQLAKPATFALVMTLAELGALSAVRFWMENQGLIVS